MRFDNRATAGEELATAVTDHLAAHAGPHTAAAQDGDPADNGTQPVVLALPRGGLPVAAPVARRLGAPLDVLLVRKMGVPRNPELAMGAVAEGGVRVLNDDLVRQLGIGDTWIQQEAQAQTRELERRAQRYRGDAPPARVQGRTAVIVDDGIATGATVRSAVQGVLARDAARTIVAVPTAAPDSVRMLEDMVDAVVCLHAPEPFRAVALWYRDFPQVSDDEVVRLLEASQRA